MYAEHLLKARWLFAAAAGLLASLHAVAAHAFPSATLIYVRGPGAESCPEEMEVRLSVAHRLGYDPDRLGRGGGAGFFREGTSYTLLKGGVRGRQVRFTLTAVGDMYPSVAFALDFDAERALDSISGYKPGGLDVLLKRVRQ